MPKPAHLPQVLSTTGWLVGLPQSDDPRLGYADLELEPHKSLEMDFFLENTVYGELQQTWSLRYSRARATITHWVQLDLLDPWTCEEVRTIPPSQRAHLRQLLDDAALPQLFSALCAEVPDLIGSVRPDQLPAHLPSGDDAPRRSQVWQPMPGYDVTEVRGG